MTDNVLIIGPAWVGDMVMAQTLFKLIKQRKPDTTIDVLAPAWSLPLLKRMPEISNILEMTIGHGQLALRKRYDLGKSLRVHQYTQGIVLPNSFKSALPLFWANIPQRTGWRGEMRYLVLNDLRILDKSRYPLMIERFMALGLSSGESLPKEYPIPELHISPKTQATALQTHQLKTRKPILALCPGAEFGPAKRWPAEYYAEIANAKLNEGWQVWLFGSAKDQVVTECIMQITENRCIDLAGRTTLEEAIDLMALANHVVTNDSGLMHIAAALNKPLIALYGPTSASFTPPLNAEAKILKLNLECQPCFARTCPLQHQNCMRELQPRQVLEVLS